MLTQADLEKWLTQLCLALRPLHAKNQLHGAVSPDHVLLDPQGTMHVADGCALPSGGKTFENLYAGVPQGYAAFEQYADDPAWPLGPWTDIYGLSALARSLILKQSPPDALQRMILDACTPLHKMNLPAYSPRFLKAIDQGMSLLPQDRHEHVDAFAENLGLPLALANKVEEEPVLAAVAAAVPVSTATATVTPATSALEEQETRKNAPVWMMVLVVLALIVAGGYVLRAQYSGQPAIGTQLASRVDDTSQLAQVPGPQGQQAAAVADAAPAIMPAPEYITVPDSSAILMSEPESPSSALIEPIPSIDMQAYAAAREVLLAAEQEGLAHEAGQETVETEPGHAAVEPSQDVQRQAADATPPASSASIRVGVSIKPWGEVFIDGASQGVSPPLRSLSLAPGEYRVRIVNGDLPPHQQTLTVRAGEPASIGHDFEPGG